MKKYAVLCLCLSLLSFVFVPPRNAYSQGAQKSNPLYVDGELLVKYKADAFVASDDPFIPEQILSVRGVSAETLSPRVNTGLSRVRLNGSISVEEAVRRAKADPRVEYAEPNYVVSTNDVTPNDTFFENLWGLSNPAVTGQNSGDTPADIGAKRAWDITTGSDDVVVAIIDTGVDISHPDLADNVWVNRAEKDNGMDDDGNGYVDDRNGWNFYDDNNTPFKSANDDSHGTHVAGTIGAVGNNGRGVTGVAWNVKLMPLKFLGGSKGSGSTSDGVLAINYAIEQKRRGVNVRVINASWGGPGESMSLREAIAAAGEAGILFVCSAGNDGVDVDREPEYPSGYSRELPSVVSVAAMTSSDYLASFSNYGHRGVSVAAPGENIMSTLPGERYGRYSGTSMASPHVAGVAALLLAHEPSLSPAEAKQRIIATAEPIPALASKTVNAGRVNAYNALLNRVPASRRLSIAWVDYSKKSLSVDGFGFLDGSSVVEVNGVALPTPAYDNSYTIFNGTMTRLTVSLDKKTLKKKFPLNQQVELTVYNPTTGERSARFTSARY